MTWCWCEGNMLGSKVGVWVAQLTPTPQLAWPYFTMLDAVAFLNKKWEGLSGVVPAPWHDSGAERHDDEQRIRTSQRQQRRALLLLPILIAGGAIIVRFCSAEGSPIDDRAALSFSVMSLSSSYFRFNSNEPRYLHATLTTRNLIIPNTKPRYNSSISKRQLQSRASPHQLLPRPCMRFAITSSKKLRSTKAILHHGYLHFITKPHREQLVPACATASLLRIRYRAEDCA